MFFELWDIRQVSGLFYKALFSLFLLFCAGTVQAGNGRTLVMQTQAAFTSHDPHVGYNWQDYEANTASCGNLVSVSPDDSNVEMRIAKDVAFLDDGRKILFTLNDDATFHNGRRLVADDVVYSINRVTNRALMSPGAMFFEILDGFQEYRSGQTETLRGVEALSDTEVVFTLTRPSHSFLMALTTSFGCIVPKEVYPMVEYKGLPVGAGPLKVVSLTEDGVLTFQLAEGASSKVLTEFEFIKIVTGGDPSQLNVRFARGEIDFMLDGLEWITTSNDEAERQSNDVWEEALPWGTTYVSFNTRTAPFDDARVRQAINHAVNREKIFKLLDEGVIPTTQIVPPALPEHEEDRVHYDYDPEKAMKLLKEAGFYESTPSVTLYAVDTETYKKVAFSIARDLQAIGIVTRNVFKSVDGVLEIAADPHPGDMILSDGIAWLADYPDASNFFFPILSAQAIGDGGWNWAGYTNPEAERLAIKADSQVGFDMAAQRVATWRSVFDIVMNDAPWVPLYHRKSFMLVSVGAAQRDANGELPSFSTMPFLQTVVTGYSTGSH